MSQHDFNIANQTFPSFRADLNNALQAAATISAGATAPTTPYAYQLWFDTSTNTYKARNAANSAWVSLFGNDLTNAGITLGDNEKIQLGASQDLQIFHNGTKSIVSDVGTGVLRLAGTDFDIMNSAQTKRYMLATDGGAVTLYYDNAVKITTTATGVDVKNVVSGGNAKLNITTESTGGGTSEILFSDNVTGRGRIYYNHGSDPEKLHIETAGTDAIVIDNSQNVGIGTSSPSNPLEIQHGTVGTGNGANNTLALRYNSTTLYGQHYMDENGFYQIRADAQGVSGGNLILGGDNSVQLWTGSTPAARLIADASGNVLVGKTSSSSNVVGVELSGGQVVATKSGAELLLLNRLSSDGDIALFRKDGTTVGSIGAFTSGTSALFFGSLDTALLANSGNDSIHPWNSSTNSNRDNAIDLGNSSNRFDDIYATNGTIQTSDANEKQQIAALTDAEMTAAKAISALFKTFKWNSAVETKGDAARTHAGVIAQDVQAAMTAAGLDAGDYAFFISTTWWETQTEVPAVEAVDAIDAVYEDVVIPAVEEELDEDGNVIVEAQPERTEQRLVSEAVEAVEAVAAYTRTDTYDTAEEAPEGATERTRLGIRYPELLAFIGAATEQRLTTIEARISALEAS